MIVWGLVCLLFSAALAANFDLELLNRRIDLARMQACRTSVCPPPQFPAMTCFDSNQTRVDMQCIRMPVDVWKKWATLNSEHPYARFFLDTPYCDDGIAELRAQWMEKVSEWQENIQNCTSHARKTAPADSFGFVSIGQIDAHVYEECGRMCPRFHSGIRNASLFGIPIDFEQTNLRCDQQSDARCGKVQELLDFAREIAFNDTPHLFTRSRNCIPSVFHSTMIPTESEFRSIWPWCIDE